VGVYEKLARGETVHLPEFGRETIHHVHGDDVAQLFEAAMISRQASLGESFSAVAPRALSLVSCCAFVASLFGREPNIEFLTHEQMAEAYGPAWLVTKDHIDHSPCCSIEKGQRLLGYSPRYTTEQIYVECIEYLLETGQLGVSLPL
jgi:nucleoside-diphosphate-sugar epimerase